MNGDRDELPPELQERCGDATYLIDEADKKYFSLSEEHITDIFASASQGTTTTSDDNQQPTVPTVVPSLAMACSPFIQNAIVKLERLQEFYTYVVCFVGPNLLKQNEWFENPSKVAAWRLLSEREALILIFLSPAERKEMVKLMPPDMEFLQNLQPIYLQPRDGLRTLHLREVEEQLRHMFASNTYKKTENILRQQDGIARFYASRQTVGPRGTAPPGAGDFPPPYDDDEEDPHKVLEEIHTSLWNEGGSSTPSVVGDSPSHSRLDGLLRVMVIILEFKNKMIHRVRRC